VDDLTNHTHEQQATLMLGGTGKTGRRVAQRLAGRGAPVRVATPSATPPFDRTDQATRPLHWKARTRCTCGWRPGDGDSPEPIIFLRPRGGRGR
jgi:nucleoside-diphosphate-sugar epimerase